ncbi:hypothetical protein ALC60_07354 [Trachymyrmex zeteki]|uniref:Uncharacterized protein n=1 Tax=Mycetomoellerius zeteki TaxID=64791 RepID=A0A151X050_9HYME|nr:hypothetical protein ALC60_07354 [Trachymyrmex zeteki]
MNDYSIQLTHSSLYYNCTAWTCKGTIRTRSLKEISQSGKGDKPRQIFSR